MFSMGAKLDDEVYDTVKNDKKNKNNKTSNKSSSKLIPKNQHQLVFTYEKRNGKPVTLVGQFYIDDKDKKAVLKLLKTKLGVGGTIKDEWIEIQGDKKAKIIEVLSRDGKDGWKFR